MPKNIVIIGAGISGLSCAWFLKKRWKEEVNITILEKSSRTGGWIQTIQQDGFLFEQGPRSCRTKGSGQATLELVEELGLQNQLIASDSSAQFRYVYVNHRLEKVPSHFWEFCRSPLLKGIIPAIIRDLTVFKGHLPDESLYAFMTRRFNAQLAERLVDPLVSGIYAGDIRKLSLQSCFPLLHQWEQQHRSVIVGALKHRSQPSVNPFIAQWQKQNIFSFKQGMETLPAALAHQTEADIRLKCTVNKLIFNAEGISVLFNQNESIEADHVISTLPAFTLASLIPALSSVCNRIPYASVAVINVGYDRPVLKQKGFGYLVPSQEKEAILGCVWDSCVFPQQNQTLNETRLTLMMGGMHHADLINHEEQCKQKALNSLAKHLNIEEDPKTIQIKMARQAIPQYEVGYQAILDEIKTRLNQLSPHLTLSGTFQGVAVNDCIACAKNQNSGY